MVSQIPGEFPQVPSRRDFTDRRGQWIEPKKCPCWETASKLHSVLEDGQNGHTLAYLGVGDAWNLKLLLCWCVKCHAGPAIGSQTSPYSLDDFLSPRRLFFWLRSASGDAWFRMSTSILITGGAGFLGSHVIDAFLLEHERWSITVLDKRTPQNPREGVAYIQTDLLRQDDINSLMTEIRPKAVVHCASLVPPLDKRFVREMERELLAINVDATRILLRCCEEQGVAAFVFTGSCSAVMDDLRHDYRNVDETHPLSFSSLTYGESKALAEQMVLNANCSSLRTCVLRPSVLVGPGDYQLIPAIHACIAKGETCFVLGDGENLWDVSYAPNVAEAHVLAVENLLSTQTAAGEAFFIQNNEPIAFRDLCLEVWKNFGHYPPFEIKIPYAIAPLFG